MEVDSSNNAEESSAEDTENKTAAIDVTDKTENESNDQITNNNVKSANDQKDSLATLLSMYYKRLFPYGLYFRWLNYGGVQKNYFQNREFSFTLKDDVYLRYQSFDNQQELEKEVQKCVPYKIDIGAVFNWRPNNLRATTNFQPLEKELVFDIDITDYDDVRTCCQEAEICKKCWPLMTIAVKCIDTALRDDFGYHHLLWVYSGRRGVHCWVCDEGARKLTAAGRSAVAEYLGVVKGGDTKNRKLILPKIDQPHPMIRRAYATVKEYFKSVVITNQDVLGTEERYCKFLDLIPDEGVRKELKDMFSKLSCGRDRWSAMTKHLSFGFGKPQRWLEEIALQFCYPRLDVNVTKGLNHLLKSPFCVHPKTGRVCVPIDPNNIDKFDPFTVPTLSQLFEDLDNFHNENDKMKDSEDAESEEKRVMKNKKDYKKTSLKASIQVFEAFLAGMEKSRSRKKLEASDLKGLHGDI